MVPDNYLIQAKKVISDMENGLLQLPDNPGQSDDNSSDPDEN
jgi:hypothetical protein